MELEPIKTKDELEFVIFCVENVAVRLEVAPEKIYDAWTKQSDLLNRYIVPGYDALHSQGKDYIVEDIIAVMEKEGIAL